MKCDAGALFFGPMNKVPGRDFPGGEAMLSRALLFFAALSWSFDAQAQVNCGAQPADVRSHGQKRAVMVAHHGKYVAYLRVSTDKQGIDGYGIDEREAVANCLNGGKWQQVETFVEVESGRRRSRPELAKAACRVPQAQG
jgi:Resolvase, N terminal domain